MFLGPVGFFAQEYLRKKYRLEGRILFTTWPYILFITCFTWFAATVGGIAQAEGWYWNPAYQVPGTFDVATHACTGGVFVGWFLTLAWSAWFGVDKLTSYISVRWAYQSPYVFQFKAGVWLARNISTICETFDEFISYLLILGISVWFEYVEFVNPDKFWNLIGNSYSDIAAASIIGLFAICYVYDKLVSDPIRSYD
jgi:hypothetical protein